ncbi:hypothetical protein [Rhodococcus sp. 077-4]|uniref:hypothetical protein n=1 Tax=Rhodococcus sp. 077-4 TaxID=2789271 RepID=UPI0039F645EB
MTDIFDRMAEHRAQVQRTPLPSFDQPRVVDSSLLYDMASLPGASPELQAYALRVGAGECRWDEVEALSRPVPPEVAEMKRDPTLIWFPHARQPPPEDDTPYRIPWQ